ncbi:unnamed protein product [Protopolystoma xenopodis]|uniref:Uncharacterized protein n=1 Tax=Protopolystoma xenopodis TaxID=117903 RepID=A0A3S5B141_9PLAT|nr:unnamed protein product [Protopolystoma xenopodis]
MASHVAHEGGDMHSHEAQPSHQGDWENRKNRLMRSRIGSSQKSESMRRGGGRQRLGLWLRVMPPSVG